MSAWRTIRPPWANGATVLVHYGTDTSPAELPFARFSDREIEEHTDAELARRYRQRSSANTVETPDGAQ